MLRMIDEVETLVKKDKTVMNQSTISEEVRLGNEALKNRVIAYWRAHPELNSVELPIANLAYHVFEKPIKDYNCFYTLSTGLILQGSKRVNVDGKRWEYGRCTWISTAADTPSSYEILEASPESPHVACALKLNPLVISDLVQNQPEIVQRHGKADFQHTSRIFTVSTATLDIIDCFMRLFRLLEKPEQISARAPLIEREITYLLLMSPQGEGLTHFFTQNSIANRINKTINWIRNNAGKPFDIDMLAEMAHMTRSTYYRHFKTITKLSPLQYHKRQCLYQAQHLMLTKGYSATQAAFEVGYASPNQFSREYKRAFGMPPRQYVSEQSKQAAPIGLS